MPNFIPIGTTCRPCGAKNLEIEGRRQGTSGTEGEGREGGRGEGRRERGGREDEGREGTKERMEGGEVERLYAKFHLKVFILSASGGQKP